MNRRRVPVSLLVLLGVALALLVFGFVMFLRAGGFTAPDAAGETAQPSAPATGVTVTDRVLDGIPVQEYFLDNGERQPVVFLLHGLGGSKADMSRMAQALAQQHFLVLCPDAYAHGDRKEATRLSPLEIAVRTTDDIDRILSHYRDDQRADVTRIALSGFSMGGFACYYYAAHGATPPTAMAVLDASPDWTDMIGRDVIYQLSGTDTSAIADPTAEKARIDAFLTEHSPFALLAKKVPGALLMIGQPQDPLVPLDGMQKLYDGWKDDPQAQVTFQQDETGRHSTTEESLTGMLRFLTETLSQ